MKFYAGQIIKHRNTKTIFESDNNLFSLLTMNPHPLHTNREYARQTRHREILVVGTLVFSLAVGLTVPEISYEAIANLEYSEVKHVGPVFVGDTINVKSVIEDVKKTSKGLHVVTVFSEVFDQDDSIVLTFKRKILI